MAATDLGTWADHPLSFIPTPTLPAGKSSSNQFYASALGMTLIHNTLLRGYNSIYLQAPHISSSSPSSSSSSDTQDFIHYCLAWHVLITSHHRSEEEHAFPAIARATGDKEVMGAALEEHELFHSGLEEFGRYLERCLNGDGAGKAGEVGEEFSGKKLVEIMDSFGPPLREHLAAEIQLLLSLERFSHLPLYDILKEDGDRNMKSLSMTDHVPALMLNIDATWEGGRWKDWPEELPWVMKWVMGNVVTLRRRGWWRFASCDGSGRPRRLYAQ